MILERIFLRFFMIGLVCYIQQGKSLILTLDEMLSLYKIVMDDGVGFVLN